MGLKLGLSLIKKEQRLKVFEDKVLKGIQTKRERAIATGGQIKLQLEELYNF
jgi:hypothetical protein